MNILSLFVIIPLVLMIVIFCINGKNKKLIRSVMTIGGGALLATSAYLTVQFLQMRGAGVNDTFLFTDSQLWYETLNIHYSVGVDGISVAMLLLSSIIVLTGAIVSYAIEDKTKEYYLWFLMLSIGVYGFFISLDLFTMFLFYEVALIPMYLLIGLWGSGNKEYSAMKLTLMLMGGSAFLMVGIFGIYYNSIPEGGTATFNIQEIAANVAMQTDHSWENIFFPLTFIGFGVLGAMFPFHTWSPDGHASAPTAVSMLHAGVLMKLGGYGCFRIAICLMPHAAVELANIFIILTGISVVYGAFSACVQNDLKYINAYSSVSHCGLVLFALLMMNKAAMTGAILQMVSHGSMTALFFALIGMIYGRTHTRDIREMGGLMKVMPVLCVCYVIAGLASLGLPGLSGFVAEMTIFVGSFKHDDTFHRVFVILGCTSIVIPAVYILRVVGKILMGPVQDKHHESLTDAVCYEKIAVFTLIAAIAAIGLHPIWLSDMIYSEFNSIIGNYDSFEEIFNTVNPQ